MWFIFLGLSYLFSRSVHLLAYFMILVFIMVEKYSIMYTHHVFVINASFEGHLHGFYFLTIVKKGAKNAAGQISVELDVESFGQTARSDKVGSYGRFPFSFLSLLHTDFQNG